MRAIEERVGLCTRPALLIPSKGIFLMPAIPAKIFGGVLCLLALLTAQAIAFAAEPISASIAWDRNYKLQYPNEPISGDFDLEGNIEVLLSDTQGTLILINAASGGVIWKTQMSGDGLLNPLVGQFMKSNSVQFALLHRNGRFQVVQASSGRVLCDTTLKGKSGKPDLRFNLSPVLLPGRLQAGQWDTVLAVSEDRHIMNLTPFDAATVNDAWAMSIIGTLADMPSNCLSVGFLNAEATNFLIAFPTMNHRLSAFNSAKTNSQPTWIEIQGMTPDQASAALPEGADGLMRQIAVSDSSSAFWRVAFDDSSGALTPIDNSSVGCAQAKVSAPVWGDVNQDGTNDIILNSPSQMQILVVDGTTGRPMAASESYMAVQPFITPMGFFMTTNKEPIAAIGDANALVLVNLLNHTQTSQILRYEMSPLAPTTPLIFDADKNGKADILVQGKERVSLVATSLSIPQGTIQWSTYSGSSLRNGGRPKLYENMVGDRDRIHRGALSTWLDDAKGELEKKDYGKAIEKTQAILDFNPRYEDALKIQKQAIARRDMGFHILYSIIGVALAAALLACLWRWFSEFLLLKRTKEWASHGADSEILQAFRKHQRFLGLPMRLVCRLAEVSDQLHMLPVDFTTTLEKAHSSRPANREITRTLARLYLQQPNLDPEAIRVYEIAAEASDNPAPYDLAIGRIYMKIPDMELAKVHLEKAYKQGERSVILLDCLAQVYALKGETTARNLPVFEVASRNSPANAQLLEGLARCYVAAGHQKEAKAQDVFQKLSEICPTSAIANQEIAAAAYRLGDLDKAILAAEAALRTEPNNAVALMVLAWCLWQRKDLDEEARRIYMQAYRQQPNDSLLLRIVSELSLDRLKRRGDETAERLTKAVEANPNDRDFLNRAAKAAQDWDRDDLMLKKPGGSLQTQ